VTRNIKHLRRAWSAAIAVGLAVIILLVIFWKGFYELKEAPGNSAITISLLGLKQTPNDHWPFARFVISNGAPYDVRIYGFWSEVEGNGNDLAPIVNPSDSECHFQSVLKSHSAVTNAIGQPSVEEPIPAPWRFNLSYAQMTLDRRWDDFVWHHRWLARYGAMRLIDDQSILSPTNHHPVSGPWMERHKMTQ
jgi:hypothetical protein